MFCFLELYSNLDKMLIFGICFVLLFMKMSGRIFIVCWVFIKRTELQSTFLNNDKKYDKVLNQNIQFKTKNTERTERRKTSFPKEQVENADLHKSV